MQAFWITYLGPVPENAEAKLEPITGLWRHKTLQQGASARELSAELRARGCTALSVNPAHSNPLQVFDRSITRQYKVDLLSAVAYNMSAGMSASKAFEMVAAAETGPARVRLDNGLQVISRGGSFAEAIAAVNIYDETTNILLTAGERTGDLKQSLHAVIEHYTAHTKNLKGLMALAGVVFADLLFAIPSVYAVRYEMLPMVEKAGIPQGTPEQLADFDAGLRMAYTVNDGLIFLAAVVGLLVFAGVACLFDKATRAWLHGVMRSVPLLGTGIRDSALSASTKALASLLSGGVTLVHGLEITAAGVKHPEIADYWKSVMRRLEGGDSVARAMRSTLLTQAESMLLSAHQNQAQLAEILKKVAERRSDSAAKFYQRFAKWTIYTSIAYTVASAAAGIYVYSIQASAMSAGL